MNPNYETKVKEEIDKLLRVGFIRLVKRAIWLSPIVLILKKNGQIKVCVDYRKLNAATITKCAFYVSSGALGSDHNKSPQLIFGANQVA